MYGKFFASTYTGSMFGAGSNVFAVWGYVIANTIDGQVELNPRLLSAALGASEDDVIGAIDYLCSPDPRSRSKVSDGKRLIREGEFAYRVPTFQNYRNIRNEEERREYNRIKKAEERARKKVKKVNKDVNDCQACQPRSANTEAEAEADTEKEKQENLPSFPPDFDQGQVLNPPPEKKSSKHAEFKDLIFRCYAYLNNGELPPWDGSDAKQLSLVIRAKPDLDATKFHQWLANYAASENINPAARPREFLPRISDYTGGPLNKFGRPCDQN